MPNASVMASDKQFRQFHQIVWFKSTKPALSINEYMEALVYMLGF